MLVLGERGKLEYQEKNLSEQSREQQTQPTYDAEFGNRTRATLVGGECPTTWNINVLSPIGGYRDHLVVNSSKPLAIGEPSYIGCLLITISIILTRTERLKLA